MATGTNTPIPTTPRVTGTFVPTQANDITFGEQKEQDVNVLELLQDYLQTTLQKKTQSYSVVDFENPSKTIMVELKSRRIPSTRYDTALIGTNKIAFAEQMKEMEVWFAYCYTDGVFVIKYDKELFGDFDVNDNYRRGARPDCAPYDQSVVYIPIKHLTKIEYSYEEVEVEDDEEEKEEMQEEEKTPVNFEDVTLPHASGVIPSNIPYDA